MLAGRDAGASSVTLNHCTPPRDFMLRVAVAVFQEAPTNKLLYAKDIPTYKEEVKSYYKAIRDLPPLSSLEMEEFLTQESKVQQLRSRNKPVYLLLQNSHFRVSQQAFFFFFRNMKMNLMKKWP